MVFLEQTQCASNTQHPTTPPPQQTLQHTRYPNVFGIGDCAAVPTSKTAAAAAAQFLVLRDNLDALLDGRAAAQQSKYDGYTSCPLVTRKGACMMMEFGYGGKILETFTPLGLVDQSEEGFLMWLVSEASLLAACLLLLAEGDGKLVVLGGLGSLDGGGSGLWSA
jgi:sulfide:quinone oxidoreductase